MENSCRKPKIRLKMVSHKPWKYEIPLQMGENIRVLKIND
jgi:hypothetical protein